MLLTSQPAPTLDHAGLTCTNLDTFVAFYRDLLVPIATSGRIRTELRAAPLVSGYGQTSGGRSGDLYLPSGHALAVLVAL